MNKKFIVLALAALPAGAALADVTVYGEIRGGYEYNKSLRSNVAPTTSNGKLKSQGDSQINDWESRIGFKGNEDLGNGLKAIWQVEAGVNIDGSDNDSDTGGFASRESFIGLAGEQWGQLRLGKISNYAYSDMQQVDPGYYSSQSVGGLGYFTRLDGRVKNAVRYDSPEWAGFSFGLLYGSDEQRAVTNVATNTGNRTNSQTINVGLTYDNKEYGFFGRYSYQRWGDAKKAYEGLASADTPDSNSANLKDWHRLEVGYDANHIVGVLGYQQIQGYGFGGFYTNANSNAIWNAIQAGNTKDGSSNGGGGDNKLKARELAVTLGYRFLDDKLTPYFSFVKGWDVDYGSTKVSNSGYKQYVLGLNYDISKRTSAYGSYGHVKWNSNYVEKENSFGVGLVHRF